ncbi:hypothetical protein NDU88_003268 [Pleurodeles waltl]|uniref:Secreted protein n=1 Tax=Pleurodeles waltl TaxID=8319 RepID=A0AAV7W5H7_PLEWA|nr:hypothetical protein NDU88_003268 [Pleurodeles waltl]
MERFLQCLLISGPVVYAASFSSRGAGVHTDGVGAFIMEQVRGFFWDNWGTASARGVADFSIFLPDTGLRCLPLARAGVAFLQQAVLTRPEACNAFLWPGMWSSVAL